MQQRNERGKCEAWRVHSKREKNLRIVRWDIQPRDRNAGKILFRLSCQLGQRAKGCKFKKETTCNSVTSAESAKPGGYIAKERKICELCGGTFNRVIGTQEKYCFACHANWGNALKAASSRKRRHATA